MFIEQCSVTRSEPANSLSRSYYTCKHVSFMSLVLQNVKPKRRGRCDDSCSRTRSVMAVLDDIACTRGSRRRTMLVDPQLFTLNTMETQ